MEIPDVTVCGISVFSLKNNIKGTDQKLVCPNESHSLLIISDLPKSIRHSKENWKAITKQQLYGSDHSEEETYQTMFTLQTSVYFAKTEAYFN